MKINFTIISLLLCSIFVFGQRNEIKEAQKEFKNGNFQQTIAVLSPVEYLIKNATNEEQIHFYFLMGSSTLDLAKNNINVSKNLMHSAFVFKDLIIVEQELGKFKYTTQALSALLDIKDTYIQSANQDVVADNFAESSAKYYQAYLLDKKDTIQLYNAALSYQNAALNDMALKCFEQLATLNFSGNYPVYIAYSKEKKEYEAFNSMEERDSKIKDGTYLNPKVETRSRKSDLYRNLAIVYVEFGFKEKAIKALEIAKNLSPDDHSFAFMEANLYLEIKNYEVFDQLAAVLIAKSPGNVEIVSNFGLSCLNEKYYQGAEYYFQKALKMDPQYANGYVNLSTLIIEKGMIVTEKLKKLGTSSLDRKNAEVLKLQRETIMKSVIPYLQKGIRLDPANQQAVRLLSSMNDLINLQTHSKAFASEY